MLIESQRHTARDLAVWAVAERMDAINARRPQLAERARRAVDAIAEFAARDDGACYAGTSWGKDSTVLAHLVAICARERGVRVPMVFVHVQPHRNPDCLLVRDRMLAAYGDALDYHEIAVECVRGADGLWVETGRLETGFARAAEMLGPRYISGVRADESSGRRKRMGAYGASTRYTCAPIGWWTGEDVYAYLHAHGLPVHPAYACTMGGMLDRDRIRVATLGGSRGTGWGRREWEWTYYRDEMRALGVPRTQG